MVCETSTSEEDWRELKDYFADASTSLDEKNVNYMYYDWSDVTLHFMVITNRAKVCNTKSVLACNAKKVPTHMIA